MSKSSEKDSPQPEMDLSEDLLPVTKAKGSLARSTTWRTLFASFLVAACFMHATSLQAQAAEQADDSPSGFFEILFSGGIIGVIIVLVLLSLSVYSAYLIVDHFLTVRRSDLIPEGLGETVREQLMAGDVRGARATCEQQPSFLSFVLMHGIAELEFGYAAVEKAIEEALAEQSARLFRKIEYLSVIGNIAPMVGLLGTVIGMIMAFRNVASTQGTASAPQLAEGIYQALVTTVGGLIVAIPSIGAFAIFRNRIDQFVAEAAYVSQHVFSPLRRKKKRPPG